MRVKDSAWAFATPCLDKYGPGLLIINSVMRNAIDYILAGQALVIMDHCMQKLSTLKLFHLSKKETVCGRLHMYPYLYVFAGSRGEFTN